MVDVDYYVLLNVARTASEDELRAAIKKMRRVWAKRVQAPDLDARQEAEKWMENLRAAEGALLAGEAARQRYDQALAQGVRTQAPVGAPAGGGGKGAVDWVEKAREALALNDYHSAAYAAREATHTIGNSAESWLLRSRANAGLGHTQDALYEAKQAVTIEPNNAGHYFHQGALLESVESWDQALQAYQTAGNLDPNNFVYHLAQGSVFSQNGFLDRAIEIFRRVLGAHPGEAMVKDYLARALFDKAETIPKHNNGTSYAVSSREEITAMRGLIDESEGLSSAPDLREAIATMRAYLTKMEASSWNVSGLYGHSSLKAVGIPILMFVVGLLLTGASGGLAAVLIIGSFVAAAVTYKTCWVPAYQANARRLG